MLPLAVSSPCRRGRTRQAQAGPTRCPHGAPGRRLRKNFGCLMWSSSSHIARGHWTNTQAPAVRPIRTEQRPNQHKCAAPSRFVTMQARSDSSGPGRPDPMPAWRAWTTAYKKICAPTHPTAAQDHRKEGGTHEMPSQEAIRQHPCQPLRDFGELRR